MISAVRPKPTAATLENDAVGQRSGTNPFEALVVSQKKRNVRASTSFRNSVSDWVPPPPPPPGSEGGAGAEGEEQATSTAAPTMRASRELQRWDCVGLTLPAARGDEHHAV